MICQEPGVCSLVAPPGSTSVASSAWVEHLVGEVEEGYRQEEAVGREEDIDKEEDVDKEEDCDKEEDGHGR